MPVRRRRRLLVIRASVALVAMLAALVAADPSISSSAVAAPPVPAAAGGRLLVTFKASADRGTVDAAHRAARGNRTASLRAIATEVVEVEDVGAALAQYRARPDVEWAGVDGEVHAAHHIADNRFNSQWNLKSPATDPGAINWHDVYQEGFGEGVLVAVVDTGVGRSLHGGFDGFEYQPFIGFDFVSGDNLPDDENGHGTHIAGTIAQRTGNASTAEASSGGASVAGIAPKARILAVRVLDDRGSGLVSNTIEGIIYATNQGAKVINLSLAGDFAKPLCDAVRYATDRGALVVAASGNESESAIMPVAYPAACPGALAVGGHQWNARRGEYSNGSCELGVTGPGGDLGDDPGLRRNQPLVDPRNGILQEATDDSLDGFGFFYDSGTSMAAAHAAGAAAVLMGIPYFKSGHETSSILRATARDLGPAGQDIEFGAGAIDLAAAIDAATTLDYRPPADRVGYWMVASDGGIFAFGDARFEGSAGGQPLNSPIVGMAPTPSGRGYWLAAADGGVFAYGDATFFGSAGGLPLRQPIVGIAAYPNGAGYWLVARDGGIFAYGEDRFYGSTGGMRLNQPVVGMTPTRTGFGYWLVASDGGIFGFGDAQFQFYGSTGAMTLNRPIVGITRTPSGAGYWLYADDGGIFSFGDALFHGSTGGITLNQPIVDMVSTCFGRGYWLVARDGGVFSFGGARFVGSAGGIRLNQPIIGASLAMDHRVDQL